MRAFVFSVIIPILLVDLASYLALERAAYRGYSDDIRNVIESMDENFSIYFDQLENQLLQLSASADVAALASRKAADASMEAIALYRRASERVDQSLGARSDVASIRIYGLDGELKYSRNMLYGRRAREGDERIIAGLAGSGYGCRYVGVRTVERGDGGKLRYFTLACEVIDLGLGDARGRILVDLNFNMIDKFSSWGSIDGDFVLAFDGKVAYSKSGSPAAGQAFDEGRERVGERRFAFRYDSPSTRWTYLILADRLRIMNAVTATAAWIVGASLLCFLAFLLLFRRSIERVLASLTGLEASMERAEENGFVRIEGLDSPYRETRSLVARFNTMQEEILDLIGREEELSRRKARAEQEALQLQIAPHFLYNSLDSINCLAAMKGQSEISEMIVSLSGIFKYAASGDDGSATLGLELEYARNYCSLQAIRFQESFRVEYDLPEAYRGVAAVKFMLQPLVENAIVHGVGSATGGGLIRIGAEEAGGRACAYVWDNGGAFDPEALARYRELFARGPGLGPAFDAAPRGGRRIGLANIFLRLKLRFGDEADMAIEVGKGTKVEILLPKGEARV